MKYCCWTNSCSKKNICCGYCSNKGCKDRCTDNCNKCQYALDEPLSDTNKIQFKEKKKEIKFEKAVEEVSLFEELHSDNLIEKYQVRIGSGCRRGKSYYFNSKKDAIKKAKILEKRQKMGFKSEIIQAELIKGKEYFNPKNTISY